MKRREFITLLGGVAATWPLGARAQQTAMPVIGALYSGTPEMFETTLSAFREGLKKAGYYEGSNIAVRRWRPDCLAGDVGFEPANPSASYLLIGFA